MEYTRESIRLFAQSYKLISIYKGILDNPVGKSLTRFLDLLAETSDPDERLIEAYCDFFANLAAERSDVSLPAFFIERILADVNAFTSNPVAASNYVSDAILTDLECIQAICTFKAEALRDYLRSLYILTAHEEYLPLVSRLPLFFNEVNNLDNIAKQDGSMKSWHLIYKSLVFALEQREAFVAMLPRLRKFHETNGCGLFCRYPAVYFDGELHALPKLYYPIDHEFFDYNGMCVKLIENTARFIVHGERHNALLTGPTCLGKTTTLRLLPEQFTGAGYRYLEFCYREDLDYTMFAKLQEILSTTANGNLKIVVAILRMGAKQDKDAFYDPRLLIFSNMQKYALPENCLLYGSYDGELEQLKRLWPQVTKHFPLQLEFRLPNQEEYLASVFAFSNLAGFDVDDPHLTEAALTYAKQRQAHDLDVARDFIEVWRFMQDDKLTLTYDKLHLPVEQAEAVADGLLTSDNVGGASEGTESEDASAANALEAEASLKSAADSGDEVVTTPTSDLTESDTEPRANEMSAEVAAADFEELAAESTDQNVLTETVDATEASAAMAATEAMQLETTVADAGKLRVDDNFTAPEELATASTQAASLLQFLKPETSIEPETSSAQTNTEELSYEKVEAAFDRQTTDTKEAASSAQAQVQVAGDTEDDLAQKLDKLASELTAFHQDKLDYLDFANWEYVDDFSHKQNN